jgi:TldD protein
MTKIQISSKNESDQLSLPIDDIYFKKLQELKKKYKIQYYNVRFCSRSSSNLRIEMGNQRSAHIFNNSGFSIQTFTDGGYGFSSSNIISLEQLEKKFEESAKLCKFAAKNAETKFLIDELDPIKDKFIQTQKVKLLDVNPEDKVKYLKEQDMNARKYDKRIVNTNSNYADSTTHQIIVTSDDRIIDTTETYARIMIFAFSKEGSVLQSARESVGLVGGFEVVDKGKDIGETAAKKAIEILAAKPVKGGKYNIIIDPFLAGTFAHEAFGHAAEADSVLANESVLIDKIGKKIGPDYINIVDDPSLPGAYGSVVYDSEGIKARKVELVKNGILKEFMHSRETASRMHEKPTGNGRAQTFKMTPQVRMRCTYIEPGDRKLEEMFEELREGLYCISWLYGYTEPNKGEFQFKMERAYLIENGEKKQLLRDAALSGTILEVLNKITAVSKGLQMDDGTCGKGGQSVPVCSGGPHLLIKDTVIGGV